MDTTASNIQFDRDGFCNYCHDFITRQNKHFHLTNILTFWTYNQFCLRITVWKGALKSA